MTEHELITEGPIAYPGGKDGWFRVHCTCDAERLWWGATEAQALKPAREHQKAKQGQQRATEGQEEVSERTAEMFREGVLEWLDGKFAYRELWSIVETVRFNSKQR